MYTAIIAEDSKPILRNIQELMQSTELPIRIAATVSNGIEALKFIKAYPVDILLTDIRMPKLDGLALIEQCKLVNPRLKAVLISGYSDFEYTRKALNLQVFDYLLKPVERHQLVDVMERLVKHLHEQLSTPPRFMDTVDSMPGGVLLSGEMGKLTGLFVEMIGLRQKERFTLLLKQHLVNFQSTNIRMSELERFIWLLAEAFNNMLPHEQSWDRPRVAGEVQRLLAIESYEEFVEAVLSWTEQSFELVHDQNKKSGQELFQQLDQYLQQNIYLQLSISDVALKFHVSPSYISRIIKKHSQSTFVHYFMQLKIDEACRLITTKPELKVKDVSEVLAFGDQHYFSKVFKEYTGCSPTEYKEGRIESGSGLPIKTDR